MDYRVTMRRQPYVLLRGKNGVTHVPDATPKGEEEDLESIHRDVSEMNAFTFWSTKGMASTVSSKDQSISLLFAWRVSIVVLHLALLVYIGYVWLVNINGKWVGIDKRWSTAYLQVMTTQKYDGPVFVDEGTDTGNQTFQGFQIHGSLLWPRQGPSRVANDDGKPLFSYDCNNDMYGENVYTFHTSSTQGGGVFVIDNSCQQTSLLPTYDYAATFTMLTFLGNIDMGIFCILSIWVSLGYAVFAIPNEAQVADVVVGERMQLETDPVGKEENKNEKVMKLGEEEEISWWMKRCNWILVFLFAWNLGGVVLVYSVQSMLTIPPTVTFTAVSVMLWTLCLQVFWIVIGRTSRTLLFAAVRQSMIVSEGGEVRKRHSGGNTQYWVQFVRLNEASIVIPLLIVCVMSLRLDSNTATDLQYVFGFLTTSLGVLVVQDIMGCAVQEQIGYNVLLRAAQTKRTLPNSAMDYCTMEIIMGGVRFSWRMTIVSIFLMGWSFWVYYHVVWGWLENVQFLPPLIRILMWGVPVYPFGAVLINLVRNYLRFRYSDETSQSDFIVNQQNISTLYTVAWDMFGILCKAAITLTIVHYAYDSKIR